MLKLTVGRNKDGEFTAGHLESEPEFHYTWQLVQWLEEHHLLDRYNDEGFKAVEEGNLGVTTSHFTYLIPKGARKLLPVEGLSSWPDQTKVAAIRTKKRSGKFVGWKNWRKNSGPMRPSERAE